MSAHYLLPAFFLVAVLTTLNLIFLFRAWRLSGLLRAERLERKVQIAAEHIGVKFKDASQTIFTSFEQMEARLLTMERHLRDSAQAFRAMTPAGVQAALDEKATFAALEMTKKNRAEAEAARSQLDLNLLWLRALVGGPTDLKRAAAQGYPSNWANDLITLMDAFCDKHHVQVRGRVRGSAKPATMSNGIARTQSGGSLVR
jgi:hypothetical protein